MIDFEQSPEQLEMIELARKFGQKHLEPAEIALDRVNDKYGDFTVTRGNFWGLNEHDVPDRIGFRKTVGVDPAPLWSE